MVVASGRWLGVRLDFISEIFIGAVSLMAILLSQNAGENQAVSNVKIKQVTMLTGTLEFAVLANFSCGILILNWGGAVFSKPAEWVFFCVLVDNSRYKNVSL